MYLTKITDISQFHKLQKQWDDLLSSGGSTPLPLTHGWISSWWNEFKDDRELSVFCIYDADKLIAIAPFYEERTRYRGIPVKQLHLLTDGHSPYSDVIYDAALSSDQIIQVIKLIIKENKNDLLVFAKLPETSPTYAYLINQNKAGNYNIVIKESLVTPTIRVSGDWDEFFKNRSRKFRKSINNKLNRFKKEPEFTIDREIVTSPDAPILSEIVEISKKSWKAGINTDLGSDTAGRKFLLGLVDKFGAGEHTQVWILRKNTTPIAYEYHVIFDNIAYPIRADYDDDYKKHSPGSVLEYTALKHLFDNQYVSEYYTCADDYWYLNNWSNERREHYTIEVFSSNMKARLAHFLENSMIPIARYVRDRLLQKREK